MHAINVTIFFFILFLQQRFFANGFECYDCRSVSTSRQCIDDVGQRMECNKKYCTIYRQEYIDPPGVVQHFYRSCEDTPTYLNAVIQTPNHKAYYSACDEHLCNYGDGRVPITNDAVPKNSSTDIFVVPSIGSSGDRLFILLDKFVISAIIALVLLLQ